jgi:hypothetical protein
MPTQDKSLLWTLVIGTAAASLSGMAILLYAFAGVHLAFSVTIMAPMTVVMILCVWTRAKPPAREIFIQRLAAGLFCGVAGLIAYDGVRWLILISGTVPFNPFRAIEVFGLLILKVDVDTWITKTVGWLFHIWNGLSFAVMFTLAVGRGSLLWAIIWSLMLELAMVSTYPSIFRLWLDLPFLVVSLSGHLAFGVALGLAARGAVRK